MPHDMLDQPQLSTNGGAVPQAMVDSGEDVARLQARLTDLRRELQHCRRMAALGELMGTTTHEFNNVLTTILNFAKMGLRNDDSATREKAFQKILTAGQRAAQITNAVLGMARNRSHDPQPTDLRPIISETLLLLEREMRTYRIEISTELLDTPRAMVCGNQIQQILMNLFVNARQAMRNGGFLHIRLHYEKSAQFVDIVVRDTGTGIPPEQLPHIFDPYFSTKSGPDESGKGGTGLGLSTCKEIIESHRGKIRVQSTVGKGTAITIRLPVAESKT